MKRLSVLIVLILAAFLISCTTSEKTISKSANLEQYDYIAIQDVTDYSGNIMLEDMTVYVFDSMDEFSSLRAIGENEIEKLSPEEQQKVLILKFRLACDGSSIITTISIFDYCTDKPIASFKSIEAIWIGSDKEIQKQSRKGIDNCFKQLRESFKIQN